MRVQCRWTFLQTSQSTSTPWTALQQSSVGGRLTPVVSAFEASSPAIRSHRRRPYQRSNSGLLISAFSLGVYYCQQFTLSVCLSGCLSRSFKLLLFCFSMESSHLWPSFLHLPLYKTVFFDFWFRPPKAQNLLPKMFTKSPISRLVWQIDQRCLGLPGVFRGWPIQRNRVKCCGADHCCHGNEIWARHGDPVAYRLVFIHLYFTINGSRI